LAAGLVVLLAVTGYVWYERREHPVSGRAEVLRIGPRKHFVLPAGENRPLLVLLHGRGMSPREAIWPELVEAVDRLGAKAPTILFPDGGDHSYFHDRRDYAWGTGVLRAITSAQRIYDTDPGRVAIGGFSMGGFGALDLARQRRFCAVGGHSPALWLEAGQTPEGAFDDAEDFQRHDVIGFAHVNPGLFRGARVWLDSGDEDPFKLAMLALSAEIDVRPKIWPGEHGTRYWREHVDEYLRFYVAALGRC
jgi:S-formylglutathione hydrolase FrmB